MGNGFRIARESDLELRDVRSFLTQIRTENIGRNKETGNSATFVCNIQSEMDLVKEFIIKVHLKRLLFIPQVELIYLRLLRKKK